MPFLAANSPGIDGFTILRNGPQFDGRILAGLYGIPIEVQNGAPVATERGSGSGEVPSRPIVTVGVDHPAAPASIDMANHSLVMGSNEIFRGGYCISTYNY